MLNSFLHKHKNLSIAAIALASAIVFFAVALSTLNDWIKLLIAVLDLGVSGVLLGKLSGQEQHYGFIIVRGVAGFKQMKFIGKNYASLSKSLADFGLSLGFGVFYGWRLFGLNKKLLVHLLGMAGFFGLLFLNQTAASGIDSTLAFAISLLLGLFGIGFYFLASHAYSVLTVAGTPPGVIPIVPGVTVPWEVVFALIIVAVVHELAHGVLCVVEKLEVKSSGVLLFGFLPVGAFVEPDEKKMAKMDLHKQRRILGAGSTSNALFFVLFLAISLAFSAMLPLFVQSVSVKSVEANSTAFALLAVGESVLFADGAKPGMAENLNQQASKGVLLLETQDMKEKVRISELEIIASSNPALKKGERILKATGMDVYTSAGLREALDGAKAGETVSIVTDKGAKNAVLNSEGKLGITVSLKQTVEFQNVPYNALLFGLLYFIFVVLVFTYTLNFILAMVNLLPLFLTDGHKMILIELQDILGKKNGAKATLALGGLGLLLIILNALPWFT